jgi:Reverse transcriptase (RNA-dependent DNA polymerase)
VDLQRRNKPRWLPQIQSKMRLKRIMQIPGVDYTESFAPVESDSNIRIVIGILLFFLHVFPQDEWVLETFDVEVAFLNAQLKNPVYIEWPKGIKEL